MKVRLPWHEPPLWKTKNRGKLIALPVSNFSSTKENEHGRWFRRRFVQLRYQKPSSLSDLKPADGVPAGGFS